MTAPPSYAFCSRGVALGAPAACCPWMQPRQLQPSAGSVSIFTAVATQATQL